MRSILLLVRNQKWCTILYSVVVSSYILPLVKCQMYNDSSEDELLTSDYTPTQNEESSDEISWDALSLKNEWLSLLANKNDEKPELKFSFFHEIPPGGFSPHNSQRFSADSSAVRKSERPESGVKSRKDIQTSCISINRRFKDASEASSSSHKANLQKKNIIIEKYKSREKQTGDVSRHSERNAPSNILYPMRNRTISTTDVSKTNTTSNARLKNQKFDSNPYSFVGKESSADSPVASKLENSQNRPSSSHLFANKVPNSDSNFSPKQKNQQSKSTLTDSDSSPEFQTPKNKLALFDFLIGKNSGFKPKNFNKQASYNLTDIAPNVNIKPKNSDTHSQRKHLSRKNDLFPVFVGSSSNSVYNSSRKQQKPGMAHFQKSSTQTSTFAADLDSHRTKLVPVSSGSYEKPALESAAKLSNLDEDLLSVKIKPGYLAADAKFVSVEDSMIDRNPKNDPKNSGDRISELVLISEPRKPFYFSFATKSKETFENIKKEIAEKIGGKVIIGFEALKILDFFNVKHSSWDVRDLNCLSKFCDVMVSVQSQNGPSFDQIREHFLGKRDSNAFYNITDRAMDAYRLYSNFEREWDEEVKHLRSLDPILNFKSDISEYKKLKKPHIGFHCDYGKYNSKKFKFEDDLNVCGVAMKMKGNLEIEKFASVFKTGVPEFDDVYVEYVGLPSLTPKKSNTLHISTLARKLKNISLKNAIFIGLDDTIRNEIHSLLDDFLIDNPQVYILKNVLVNEFNGGVNASLGELTRKFLKVELKYNLTVTMEAKICVQFMKLFRFDKYYDSYGIKRNKMFAHRKSRR